MSKSIEIAAADPIRDIGLSSIRDSETRMREMQEGKLAELVTSMASGLINPITVRPVEGGGYCIVAGRHRLHAARKLKWSAIKCFVRNLDDDAAALIEIDENLCRAELTTDEKREHLLKRKEIWERRKGVMAHDAPKVPHGGRPKGFAADTAAATGLSKSQINRIIAQPKPRPEPNQPPPKDIEAEQRQRLLRVYQQSLPVVRRWFRMKIGAER